MGANEDVEHTAHFEFAANEVDDGGSVVVADPAPDAMQADVVELGQVSAMGKVGKRFVVQLGVCTADSGQLLGKCGLAGIEIGALPRGHRGGCMQVGGQALAKTQFTGVAKLRQAQASVQKGELDAQWVQLGVVAKGVANVGHIACAPIAHVVAFSSSMKKPHPFVRDGV
jgi:hypothetical protein